MEEDKNDETYRQGETLYLYKFKHPTINGTLYMIYAHSQKEAEAEFRRDWENLYEPEFIRRTQW